MEKLLVPQGQFELARYPRRKNELLRAWDAADELILNHIYDEMSLCEGENPRVLILNDGFGALSVGLSVYEPTTVSDSWLSHHSIQQNLKLNAVLDQTVCLLDSLVSLKPQHETSGAEPVCWDWVLLKVPKSLAMLDYQLQQLAPYVNSQTRIVGACMVKYLRSSSIERFEAILGETHTSLAKKKARLIFCTPSAQKQQKTEVTMQQQFAIPDTYYHLEPEGLKVASYANVFAREKLDIGTRFFLTHLPPVNQGLKVIDLGCGNGVVGLKILHDNSEVSVTFIDESYMAVASACHNVKTASLNAKGREAVFQVADSLNQQESASVDIIFNNPPFHQQNTVSDEIAQRMFRDAKRVLKPGGQLWVIGNRHLGYHVVLKRLFGNCDTVASNKKFIILMASK